MERIGEVIKVNGKDVVVRIKRASSCGENCASCKGCASTSATVTVENDKKVSVGDMVKLSLRSSSFILLAFIGYILPILLTIGAYFLFFALFSSEAVADIGAMAVLFITFLVFFFLDKRISELKVFKSKISKVIGDGSSEQEN